MSALEQIRGGGGDGGGPEHFQDDMMVAAVAMLRAANGSVGSGGSRGSIGSGGGNSSSELPTLILSAEDSEGQNQQQRHSGSQQQNLNVAPERLQASQEDGAPGVPGPTTGDDRPREAAAVRRRPKPNKGPPPEPPAGPSRGGKGKARTSRIAMPSPFRKGHKRSVSADVARDPLGTVMGPQVRGGASPTSPLAGHSAVARTSPLNPRQEQPGSQQGHQRQQLQVAGDRTLPASRGGGESLAPPGGAALPREQPAATRARSLSI